MMLMIQLNLTRINHGLCNKFKFVYSKKINVFHFSSTLTFCFELHPAIGVMIERNMMDIETIFLVNVDGYL